MNGTTGESLSLTVEERARSLEAWLKESAGRLPKSIVQGSNVFHYGSCMLLYRLTVVAHVGCESIRDTCELVRMYNVCIMYV